MGIFRNNSNGSELSDGELSLEAKDYKDESEFRLYIVKELHKCINEVCSKIAVDNASKFEEQINELAGKFTSSEKPKRLERFFEKYRETVSSNITLCIKHLSEKEKEFKDIIKILTEGISTMSYNNRGFNANIVEHSSKLKGLHFVDDLIGIKERLKSEITQVCEIVKKKVEKDTNQLRLLSKKVIVLSDDLKKTEAASMTDKLSGAFNRQAFDKHINTLVEKMSMRWSSFSVIMIDIDNFKKINDTYGHLVGDRVIIATVQKCKSILRKNDFIARYGGEEFIIILNGSSLKIAQRKGNDICKVISLTDFMVDKQTSNNSLSFTVSIGVSTFRDGDTVLSIVDRADKALYKAKETGKNCVVTEKELN